jgi:hypothetical protein
VSSFPVLPTIDCPPQLSDWARSHLYRTELSLQKSLPGVVPRNSKCVNAIEMSVGQISWELSGLLATILPESPTTGPRKGDNQCNRPFTYSVFEMVEA